MTKVLVIEDDKDLSESILRALEMRGHDFVLAESVEAAARALDNGEGIDVALIDHELPDGTGIEILRGIRDVFDPDDRPHTIYWSGLDRTKELAAAGVTPDQFFTKGAEAAREVIDAIEAVR